MRSNTRVRLEQLEARLNEKSGVALVQQVENGYSFLPDGGTVYTLEELNRQYDLVIIDDV